MMNVINTVDCEMWSPIVIYNDNIKPYYFISTFGRVYSLATNTFIIPHENHNGYLQVSLMTETGRVFRKVHRLVMLTFAYFHGCEMLQVNHKDTNKKNNALSNLEWVTRSENTQKAYDNKQLVALGKPKLTPELVREIRKNKENLNREQLARKYNVSCSCIQHIRRGRTWKNI